MTKPSTNNIDIIRLASWRWRRTSDDIKQGWKSKVCEVNELPTLGIFTLTPSVITKDAVLNTYADTRELPVYIIYHQYAQVKLICVRFSSREKVW